jgi:hypothetical protein
MDRHSASNYTKKREKEMVNEYTCQSINNIERWLSKGTTPLNEYYTEERE